MHITIAASRLHHCCISKLKRSVY